MACKIVFQDGVYTEEQFAKVLKNGLLYNLLDRKVLNMPEVNMNDIGTSVKEFNQHFVSNKADVKKSMMDVFGLPEKEADAVAEIYDRMAYAYASRNNTTKEKFYQKLTIFKGDPEALKKVQENVLYSKTELEQIEKEKEEAKITSQKNGTYLKAPNKKKSNLTEDQWLTVQTPTFKKWFKDSDVLDENGEPKVMFHGSRQSWTIFDNTKGDRNVGLFLSPEIDFALDYTGNGSEDRVVEFFTSSNKTFDYESKEHLKVLEEKAPHLLSQLKNNFFESQNYQIIESVGFQNFLKTNEFTGYYVKEQDVKNLAIFNSNQVKVSDGRNQTFLSDNPNILNQDASAAVVIAKDGRAIIYALTNPNVSSPLHELAHIWEKQLRPNEIQDILDWTGQDEWNVETSEKFARGFEKYLADGNAPTTILGQLFDQFKNWLSEVYKGLVGSPIDLELNDPMKAIYTKMLGEKYKTDAEKAIEAEKAAQVDENGRLLGPDTMGKRIAEYVEPVKVDKEAETKKVLDQLNQQNKHLYPIPDGALDYYGRVSEIQNALRNGTYVTALQEGTIDEDLLRAILNSVKWSTDNPENNPAIAEKRVQDVLFRANDTGATFSTDALVAMPTDHPMFQNLANYFMSNGTFEEALKNGTITYPQARIILDTFIGVNKENSDKASKIRELIDKKIGKQSANKKVVEKKIQKEEAKREDVEVIAEKQEEAPVIIPEPIADVTPEPEIITPQETQATITYNGANLGNIDLFEGVWYKDDIPVGLTREEAEQTLIEEYNQANSGKSEKRDAPAIKESPVAYADKLSKMSEAEREDLDFHENVDGWSLYEGRQQMPKKQNSVKFKKVDEDVVLGYQYEYLANINGIPYGLTKEEDPDDPDNDKAFVWNYTRLDDPKNTTSTYISDNNELVREIQDSQKIKDEVAPTQPVEVVTPIAQLQEGSEKDSDVTPVDVIDPIIEDETPAVTQYAPTTGYGVGSRVSAVKRTGTITGVVTEIDEDGYARLEDGKGGFVGYANVNTLTEPIEQVEEVEEAIVVDDRVPESEISDSKRNEDKEKRDMLTRVAERMTKFLPSVNFEIGYFRGSWKGRIKNGRVEVNLNNASLDTPIHEFMHPFVLALRLSNYDLYTNLLDELRFGPFAYNLDLVNNDPSYSHLPEYEREEEALVRFLAEDIQSVFNERGQIDLEAKEARQKSFLANVYQWFKTLWDKIWDTKQKSIVKVYDKSNINNMLYVTYNKKTGLLRGFTADAAARAKENMNLRRAELVRTSENKEEAKIKAKKIKAEPSDSFRITDVTDEKELAARGVTPAMIEEILHQSNIDEKETTLVYRHQLPKAPKAEIDANSVLLTSVSDIPVNIKLRDLADFIVGQEKIGIDLSAEQTAIDKLEAYQMVTNDEANDILKKVKNRLEGFADEANRRVMNAQILPTQANAVKRILRDYDGVEGVAEYVRQGMDGLNLAYRMVRYIQEDLKKPNLTSQDINELNRDLAEVRSLIGFYSDVANLSNYVEDEFDKDELKSFKNVLAKAEVRKGAIVNIATDLQAKWLFPYLEDAQKNLPAEKRLTFEQFKRNLRFVDRDASSMTYWLGATINSRDPLTAILAVAVKDRLNEHHIEEIDKLNDIRTIFDRWQKRTGVKNTIGAIEDYYKQNYLRKAKVWETWFENNVDVTKAKVGDKITSQGKQAVITEVTDYGAKVSGYVERWAFHEEFYMDMFEDDFRKFRESLPQPQTEDEWNDYNARITAWVNANNVVRNVNGKTQMIPSAKYANPNFTRVASDEYFNVLYSTYKEGNEKYGDRKLQFGIVPQAYRPDSMIDKGKNLLKGAKDAASALGKKDNYTFDNAVNTAAGAANYVFDADAYMSAKDLNLDGTYYRGVKSPFTHLVDTDRLDLRLNESVFGFYSAANTFSSLREVQANVDNLKMLVEGNPLLRVQARAITQTDKNGKSVFDRFLNRPQNKEGNDARINRQLVEFVNDVFYGEDEFQANFKLANGKINVNLNKFGRNIGFMTALTNMAGNVFAGISNVAIGNIMSFGEAFGGRHYTTRDWAKAVGTYTKSTPEFLADVTRPVKSKITQLGILYDAIQGEFRDKYGKGITGNIAQKYAQSDSFFIINHVAEHQIQLTGMLALMNATKVKLQNGKEVSLYDSYEKNAKGFYKMRADAIWSKEDENQFSKTLHGISKDLNGNYAAFDKGTIQRHWWGKIALQYRKYLYPAWRSRFAAERIDYERGTVEQGYYKTFLSKLAQDIKDYKFNIIGLIANQARGFKKGAKGWTAEQQYAHRKTMFDLIVVGATTFIAAALASMEADDDDKWAKNALQLQALRLRSDLSQFNLTIIPEMVRQVKNPSASLNTLTAWGEFIQQLGSPTEEYVQKSGSHDKGDSKLGAKFSKVVPLYRQYLRHMHPDEMVKYYQLINKDVDKETNKKDENQ